jgi:hypothetical protein
MEPGTSPIIEVQEVECVAGRGIRGDRFFDYREDYKGQITFFAIEVFNDVCQRLGVQGCCLLRFDETLLRKASISTN